MKTFFVRQGYCKGCGNRSREVLCPKCRKEQEEIQIKENWAALEKEKNSEQRDKDISEFRKKEDGQ